SNEIGSLYSKRIVPLSTLNLAIKRNKAFRKKMDNLIYAQGLFIKPWRGCLLATAIHSTYVTNGQITPLRKYHKKIFIFSGALSFLIFLIAHLDLSSNETNHALVPNKVSQWSKKIFLPNEVGRLFI
ncbi:hypothetical protein ACJX0J_037002, partial [Zea mays]